MKYIDIKHCTKLVNIEGDTNDLTFYFGRNFKTLLNSYVSNIYNMDSPILRVDMIKGLLMHLIYYCGEKVRD